MTIRSYKIENGVVTDGLVGTAQWATEQYGGFWVETETKAWIGGTWNETDGFQPPAPPEPPVE
jgi:hypothetical protein